ncbi:hypothetical protein DW069_20615 [Bacteroides thetaiotaomicron]|nr:hypothetical protein DW069_20615 [Bacteroides thetaiotaomicron]
MGFENKEEFRPILTTAKELLIASGEVELVKILNSAELSVIQTSYDNWNGGIYYYTMYVNVSVPDFVRLQSCNIEDIEKRILEAINTASRSIDDEVVGQVLITPKSVAKMDWSLLDGISKKDLENKIEYLRNVMVSVATGGQRIQDVEKEYSQIYNQVAISLKKIDVENPNPFKSLWDWYGKWRNDFPKYQERRDYIRKMYGKWRNDFPKYQERRDYIRKMYEPVVSLFSENEDSRIVDIKIDLSDWDKIKRNIIEIKKREAQAVVEEQYQAVGMLCREVIISLAQAVYIPEKHISLDGVEISKTDAKRMLDAYIAVTLAGKESEELRSYAKVTNKLANVLTHKRTATKQEMLLCTSATLALINLIGVLEEKF